MMLGTDFREAPDPEARAQLDLLDGLRTEAPQDPPRVRVSARAKRLSLRVYPDARVEVVAPRRARPAEIERFVAAHREWIEEKRSQALRHRPAPQPFPPARLELRATGESFALIVVAGGQRTRVLERGPDAAEAGGVASLVIRGGTDGASLRRALRTWLLQAARERLEPRLNALAAQTQTRHARVAIRRQRSRWGSCSARGTISLNCCLLFQRPEVVDYLLVHELMHVRHMNHSAHFWQSVERHCADWRELDRELLQGWRHVPRWVFSDEA